MSGPPFDSSLIGSQGQSQALKWRITVPVGGRPPGPSACFSSNCRGCVAADGTSNVTELCMYLERATNESLTSSGPWNTRRFDGVRLGCASHVLCEISVVRWHYCLRRAPLQREHSTACFPGDLASGSSSVEGGKILSSQSQ